MWEKKSERKGCRTRRPKRGLQTFITLNEEEAKPSLDSVGAQGGKAEEPWGKPMEEWDKETMMAALNALKGGGAKGLEPDAEGKKAQGGNTDNRQRKERGGEILCPIPVSRSRRGQEKSVQSCNVIDYLVRHPARRGMDSEYGPL